MTSTLPASVDPARHPGGPGRPLGPRAPRRPREPQRPRLPPGLRRERAGGPRAGDPGRQEAGRLRPGRPRLPEGVRRRGRLGRLGHLDRDAGLRRPVADGQGRRPVGPVRRRAADAGHQAAAREVPARRHELRPAGLLRHDRDRPRLRRPAAADDVHLRPRHRDLRPAHPAPGRPQGLHRQRGQGRPDGGRLRAAHHPGQEPRRARLAGADPQRGRHALPGRHHRGRRRRRPASTASTTAG